MNAIEPRDAGRSADAFLARYAERRDRLGGDAQVREDAASLLRESGLPSRRVEAWKYTDLRPLAGLRLLADAPFVAADQAAALLGRFDLASGGLSGAARLVFVNGRLDEASSRLAAGIAVEHGVPAGTLSRPEREAFVALNGMLSEDGARIRVGAGVDAGRLLVVLLGAGPRESGAVSSHPRVCVLLEAGARLSLLEIAHGEGLYVNNPVLEVELRDRAHLDHVLLQDEGMEALHFSTVYADVAAGAAYDSFSLALGARLVVVEFEGRRLLVGVTRGGMALIAEGAAEFAQYIDDGG